MTSLLLFQKRCLEVSEDFYREVLPGKKFSSERIAVVCKTKKIEGNTITGVLQKNRVKINFNGTDFSPEKNSYYRFFCENKDNELKLVFAHKLKDFDLNLFLKLKRFEDFFLER